MLWVLPAARGRRGAVRARPRHARPWAQGAEGGAEAAAGPGRVRGARAAPPAPSPSLGQRFPCENAGHGYRGPSHQGVEVSGGRGGARG